MVPMDHRIKPPPVAPAGLSPGCWWAGRCWKRAQVASCCTKARPGGGECGAGSLARSQPARAMEERVLAVMGDEHLLCTATAPVPARGS